MSNDTKLNDHRLVFRGSTLSNYKISEVKKQYMNETVKGNIEPSCYWSAELICSGLYQELWECIIFIASKYNKIDKLKNIFSEVFGLLGFLLIIISIIFFDKNTPFPSLYTLLPVVGTGLIILFTNPKTILGKLLSNKHIVGFGLISYSLYLWHQPIFAFARIYMIDEIPVYIYFVLTTNSFG